MRFNHMELTFPRGTLTKEFREEIDGFYGAVFGWTGPRHQSRWSALPHPAARS